MGSTASALYLCIRNLVGGLGPITVAVLAAHYGLQAAMMLIPVMYLASGIVFVYAERMHTEQDAATAKAAEDKAAQAQAQAQSDAEASGVSGSAPGTVVVAAAA